MFGRAVVVGLAMLAGTTWAEPWADEPEPMPSAPLEKPPLFGVTAGAHLTLGLSYVAPLPGARLGFRVRLGQHAALSAMAMYELDSISVLERGRTFDSWTETIVQGHRVHGVLRLEGFSVSAFKRLLVPEFSVGLFAGVGFEVAPSAPMSAESVAVPSFLGGIHLSMTRLRPSGWWFPLFLELGVEFFTFEGRVTPALWRLAIGVGI